MMCEIEQSSLFQLQRQLAHDTYKLVVSVFKNSSNAIKRSSAAKTCIMHRGLRVWLFYMKFIKRPFTEFYFITYDQEYKFHLSDDSFKLDSISFKVVIILIKHIVATDIVRHYKFPPV